MVPTVKKNYSILSKVFCSIFFDDFLELLFSPFTRNFASAVNKPTKVISCKLRARMILFWPGVSNDIREKARPRVIMGKTTRVPFQNNRPGLPRPAVR